MLPLIETQFSCRTLPKPSRDAVPLQASRWRCCIGMVVQDDCDVQKKMVSVLTSCFRLLFFEPNIQRMNEAELWTAATVRLCVSVLCTQTYIPPPSHSTSVQRRLPPAPAAALCPIGGPLHRPDGIIHCPVHPPWHPGRDLACC